MLRVLRNKTLGGALLVAGTAIGAGMLALPITTGVAGFHNALWLFLLSFCFMLQSVFLLLEANLYCEDPNANIVSMARAMLGPVWQPVAWASFLLILYAVAAAYLSGAGSLIMDLAHGLSWTAVNERQGVIVFAAVFSGIVFAGVRWIDWINRGLMIGLLASFLLLIFLVTPHVRLAHLQGGHAAYLWAAVPVVVLSFTSHIIVPSLRTYLGDDVRQLVKVLLLGSLIPLLCYVVWEFFLVSLLPFSGEHSLLAIAKSEHPVANLIDTLNAYLQVSGVGADVGSFSFFALSTSFLGVALSLMDFLADGLHMRKDMFGRLLLLVMTIVPPLLFALYFPHGFVLALGYAGVFVAILYGVLPVLMVWKARYRDQRPSRFRVWGGKLTLSIVMLGALAIIVLQVLATLKQLPTP